MTKLRYAEMSEVAYDRSDEAYQLKDGPYAGRWVWPAVNGGWIMRWNDRHGDCWNAWLPNA